MIATVYKTGAGRVFAFDRSGRQLPEFQGSYAAVRPDVLAGASAATVFKHWSGTAAVPDIVPAEQW